MGPVGGGGQPLHVSGGGEGEYAFFLFDEVLNVDFVLYVLDFGEAAVAVFLPDFQQLFPHHAPELFPVGQQLGVIGDPLRQLVALLLQLFPVQALEGDEPHVTNGLGLDFV